jgi:hypothetical protein
MENFDLKKFLTENKLTTASKVMIKESTQPVFTLDELDAFLMSETLYLEDEILEALPNWAGGDLADAGHDIFEAWDGLRESYKFKPIYVREVLISQDSEVVEKTLIRVQQIIPKNTTEPKPDVYLIEMFSTQDLDLNWNLHTRILALPVGGTGASAFILPKKMFAAFETFIEGGARGSVRPDASDNSQLYPA